MLILCLGSQAIILLLYVDDIVLTKNYISTLRSFIDLLSCQFAMKDLRDLHYFLGVYITHSSIGLFLSQFKYTYDLVNKFHMHTCNLVCISSAARTTLSLFDGELLVEPI